MHKSTFNILAAALLSSIIFTHVAGATNYNFGGDTTGVALYSRTDSSYVVDTVTSPANAGTLDSGIIWLDANYNVGHLVSIIIYKNDSTFLDSTARFVVSTNSRTRYKANFIQKGAIAASTRYFVGIHLASTNTGDSTGAIRISITAAVNPKWWYKEAQAVIPATITGPATTSGYSIAMMLYYSSTDAGGQVIIIGSRELIEELERCSSMP
jgi:hypothetical protein